MSRRGGRWCALLVCVALLAACSGGGGGDDDDAAPRPDAGDEATGPAVDGGRLIVALDGEPDGLDPVHNTFSPAGLTEAMAVYDPLMAVSTAGDVVPYLAQSMTHDDDYTHWTIRLRAGITFSDGSPLDAAAVARVLDAQRQAELTRAVLRDVESVATTDPLTVDVGLQRPWVAFPAYLTGRIGLVPSPSTLDGGPPVGTGAFVVDQQVPGDHVTLRRNPTYWRADDGLPYVDEIEVRPVPALADRADALADGRVDVVHASEAGAADALDDAATVVDDRGAEIDIVFNTAVPPFDEVECRRAVAAAVAGDEPEGCDDLSFRLRLERTEEAVATRLRDAGLDVTADAGESSAVTLDALLGRFQAVVWHRDAMVDPDEQLAVLSSGNAGPVGTLAVNIGRYRDDDLDKLLREARETADAGTRAELYDHVDRMIERNVPYVRVHRASWTFAFADDIGGVRRGITSPEGDALLPAPGVLILGSLHRTTR